MKPRHAILGGSGFIGRHVSRLLADLGVLVANIDAAEPSTADDRINFIPLNLSSASQGEFDNIVRDYDVIHHYAWSTIPSTANFDPLCDLYENVGPVVKLLEAMKRLGKGRLLFASSGGTVYGKLHVVPVPETHLLDPLTAYGVTKVACEKYIGYYTNQYNVDTRIARISNPYGAGQNPFRGQGVVSTFIHNALANRDIEVWGDGQVARDFVYIEDLIIGLLKLSALDIYDASMPKIFNLGGGRSFTINEIICCIEDLIGRSLKVRRLPERSFDIPISLLNLSRAAQVLAWFPSVTIREGIQRTIEETSADPNRQFCVSRINLDELRKGI